MTEFEIALNPPIEAAIKYYSGMIFTSDMSLNTLRSIAINKLAITALREQAERDKGCEYCNRHGQHLKHIQDSVTLYKNSGNGKNAPYIIAELITGGDKAQGIRIESASADAVNRGFFEIHFCPMCGKRLGKRRESEVIE